MLNPKRQVICTAGAMRLWSRAHRAAGQGTWVYGLDFRA